jgi:diadenosine tetraphosphate (Ap4A) HIT family hydrolase
MFVVLAPPAGSDGHELTLVPTLHVPTLADMSNEDMASFLAGLSKLIRWLKETKGADVVEIRVGRPCGLREPGEQHFHLNVRTRERA